MKKISVFMVLLLSAVLLISGCGKKGHDVKNKEEVIPVRIMRVKTEDLHKVLEYVGNIQGENEAMVYPKVSGKIIEKVNEEGDWVRKGDVIAFIDRDEVGLTFEKAPVESPLDGVVGRVYVDIGSSVTSQTAVAFVAYVDKMEIMLEIPEKYLPRISIGQRAEINVDSYPDKNFIGIVSRISPVIDLNTRASNIEISIDNANHMLRSGMFAKVRLIIEENKDVFVILKEAVAGKGADTYVYVAEGNKAVLKKVALGIRQGPYYEVLSGLKEGDQVVIMGQQRLEDGSTIEAEE